MSEQASFIVRVTPVVFVLLWSSGWVTARFATDHADPLTFLAVRHALTAVALAAIALALQAPWPRTPKHIAHALVCGVFLNALYLGGVWWAIGEGVPAGVSGLISAVQPLLTALLAPWLMAETIRARQWLGIACGTLGIALVLQPKLAAVDATGLAGVAVPLLVNALGMVAATLGTFYQKRFIPTGHPMTTQTLQFTAALAVTLPVAWLIEPMRFDVNGATVAAMTWAVVVTSIGANTLLLVLLRRGAISRTAALLYLMPPMVALQAWIGFGETLTAVQLAGMAITVLGVALVTRG